MYKNLCYLIPLMLLISFASNLRAEPFSIGVVEDNTLDNSGRWASGSNPTGSGLEARDIASRRHVFLISYDISELKSKGQFSNVSFSFFSHDQHGETNIYGIIESQDLLGVESLTWNTAPGVKNDPAPPLDSPVELDPADLTDILLTFTGPGVTAMRFSTDTSQALADFLNSDTDGIVTFLFAPSAGQQLIIRSREYSLGGEFLEGEISPIAGIALNPNPADEEVDVARDVVLSWKPWKLAVKHNVYLGTNFEDVNNADADSLLLVGPAVDVNNFDAGRLEFDQTYYWRVDEVNAPPDSSVFKGHVWSFTVESFTYPIPGENINATASSQAPGQGPEQTINGSGLDANDLHSNDTSAMWLSATGEAGPAWIQYEFDKPYQLYEMSVWNYNGESILSLFGVKDVTVEYSTDGTNWTQVSTVSELAQATGANGYAANTTVPFDGVEAQYVKITATSIWGGQLFDQFGLSEVRFMVIPVSARLPNPADDATGVPQDATLSWRAGRQAAEHNVYFSDDMQAVIDGTASVATVSQAAYGPLSLDLGKTYYWRVDEVNNAETTAVWPGNIWSFTASESLVVDDFESYNDIPEGDPGSNLVYLTWIDGYDNPTVNGSTMGNPTGSSMETTTVHGGAQSVPVYYDNTTAQSSEVTASTNQLAVGRNWTVGAPESLVLWVYGDPNNAATDRMYVKVNSSKVIYDGDLSQTGWQDWSIDLASLGINLSNVTTLTIGFERTGGAGGSGMVFIDDIWLFAPAIVEQ
jgi:hypothetical protein